MNIIEQLQLALNYIDNNLEEKISINTVATKAFMSKASFYRLFYAFVGISVKQYIRNRRFCLAASRLKSSSIKVMELALIYDFTSVDSFSRAFKRITGFLPSKYRNTNANYLFERINLLDKYYAIQDTELLKKYPQIKVLKKVEDIKVAYYCYVGVSPEINAFSIMNKYLKDNRINTEKRRIFGYNNPSPTSENQQEYGYEVCITVDDNFKSNSDHIKTKTLKGGIYAILGLSFNKDEDMGPKMQDGWKIVNGFLNDSKYTYDSSRQWVEEHLNFNDDLTAFSRIDIYVPIIDEKGDFLNEN